MEGIVQRQLSRSDDGQRGGPRIPSRIIDVKPSVASVSPERNTEEARVCAVASSCVRESVSLKKTELTLEIVTSFELPVFLKKEFRHWL